MTGTAIVTASPALAERATIRGAGALGVRVSSVGRRLGAAAKQRAGRQATAPRRRPWYTRNIILIGRPSACSREVSAARARRRCRPARPARSAHAATRDNSRRSRTRRLASGSVVLEKFWTPGRASAIIASRLFAARSTPAMRLAQVLGGRLALLVDQAVGAVGERLRRAGRRSPALRAAMRASPMASARSGARSASTSVVRSTLSRMSAIEFWFSSLSSSVSRSVSRWMRSISSGAELSSAPSPPELAGMTGQPCGPIWVIGRAPLTAPSSWISVTPVKPTPLICAVVPWSTGVSSSTSIRTQTNSGRSGSSEMSVIWPTGTPEKVTDVPLLSPPTPCAK